MPNNHSHIGQEWDQNAQTISADPNVGLRMIIRNQGTALDLDAPTGGVSTGISCTASTGLDIDASRVALTTGMGIGSPPVSFWGIQSKGIKTGVTGITDTGTAGIYGESASSGYSHGVSGRLRSSEGAAVIGQADSLTGSTYGVRGKSAALNGVGVRGHATGRRNEDSEAVGVEGVSDGGRLSTGVSGIATRGGFGVHGVGKTGVRADGDYRGLLVGGTNSPTYGVMAFAKNIGLLSYGAKGAKAIGRDGYGLTARSSSGDPGVVATSKGIGVHAKSRGEDATQQAIGVKAESGSLALQAIGENYGTVTYGDVHGLVTSSPGIGLYCSGDASFTGDVSVSGDLSINGSKNFVEEVETEDGKRDVVYRSVESGRSLTEHSGVGTVEDGRAEVQLPDHFGMVTSDQDPLVVQVTPHGGDSGLRVTDRSLSGFVVEAISSGEGGEQNSADYEFSYTVKGTRKGFEDEPVVREPEADDEPPSKEEIEALIHDRESVDEDDVTPDERSLEELLGDIDEISGSESEKSTEDPIEKELATRPDDLSLPPLGDLSQEELRQMAEAGQKDSDASEQRSVHDLDIPEVITRLESLESEVERLTEQLKRDQDSAESNESDDTQ